MSPRKKATEPVVEQPTTPKKDTHMSNENINVIELDYNLEDAPDFELLPARSYEAEIRKAETRISDKGNEYYYVTFIITPDQYPADYDIENAPEGTQLTYARLQAVNPQDRRSVTAMKKFYKALGMSLKTSVIDPSLWEGKKAKLVIGRTEWQGEPRNEIKAIEAVD